MKVTELLTEDWQKVNKHDNTDGMSQKAVNAYRKENPGSKLKTAVTTKPSKLKKGSKASNRRKSFCARMSGMKKAHASAKTKRNPDSPINKALRRWNCESIEDMRNLIEYAGQIIAEEKVRLDAKCWKGKHKEGTKVKGGVRVNNCVANEGIIGTEPKRPSREGSRPARGHEPVARYKSTDVQVDELVDQELSQAQRFASAHYPGLDPESAFKKWIERALMHSKEEDDDQDIRLKKIEKTLAHLVNKDQTMSDIGEWIVQEHGKASRALCVSSKPDDELGASQLASCKSQGLRARDGEKSHLIGHRGSKVRITVGGKKIKGHKYGGPLPDYGTRKGQK